MNYLEWSREYTAVAETLAETIEKLKRRRRNACPAEKKELDQRISMYRTCRSECLETATHLMERYRGVA